MSPELLRAATSLFFFQLLFPSPGFPNSRVKLASHLLTPQVMMQVLSAPAIVVQFLIDYSNSSAELVKKITL